MKIVFRICELSLELLVPASPSHPPSPRLPAPDEKTVELRSEASLHAERFGFDVLCRGRLEPSIATRKTSSLAVCLRYKNNCPDASVMAHKRLQEFRASEVGIESRHRRWGETGRISCSVRQSLWPTHRGWGMSPLHPLTWLPYHLAPSSLDLLVFCVV